jgi:hypothetical protein
MQPNQPKQQKPKNGNFSENLAEMRTLAIAITRNKTIKIKYDPKLPTSMFNPETNQISLSLEPYPDFVKNNHILAIKVLDGDLGHELGHLVKSKPLNEYFNNWVTKIKRQRGYFKLAHNLVNIVEDRRVNHYITKRYRFDIGKRLLLANLILKDMIDNAIEPKQVIKGTMGTQKPTSVNTQISQGLPMGVYMMAILTNQGLYEGKCTQLWSKLSPEANQDMTQILEVLKNSQYQALRIDLIRTLQTIYDLLKKHLPEDYTSKQYIVSRRGGNLKGDLSDRLKEALEAEIEAEMKEIEEDEKQEHLKDLAKGGGAGEGTGEEIPAPEPDFNAYQVLLDECKPQITELLNKLKQTVKPRCNRQIFQKRGKMMSPLLSKIYVNSFRNNVQNVYTNVQTTFEKEQVAIGFLFDYSGSVDRDTAQKITTILNEVFGHYVDDGGFSISAFGADSQKVKTFFENFDNTRARIGAISVNAGGTEVSVLLEAYLKMFNAVKGQRRKILVIASDFYFGDEQKAEVGGEGGW